MTCVQNMRVRWGGGLDVEMDAGMGIPEGRTDEMPNQSTPNMYKRT